MRILSLCNNIKRKILQLTVKSGFKFDLIAARYRCFSETLGARELASAGGTEQSSSARNEKLRVLEFAMRSLGLCNNIKRKILQLTVKTGFKFDMIAARYRCFGVVRDFSARFPRWLITWDFLFLFIQSRTNACICSKHAKIVKIVKFLCVREH